jgi:hypothetical protein
MGDTPAILASNDVGLVWTAVWWLSNYGCPGLVERVMAFLPARAAARAALNILRATLVASRVDAAVARYPGVIAAPLLLGALGGAGGKLASDPLLRAVGAAPPRAPTEFSAPGLALRSAFIGAGLQYLLAHVSRVLVPAEAGARLERGDASARRANRVPPPPPLQPPSSPCSTSGTASRTTSGAAGITRPRRRRRRTRFRVCRRPAPQNPPPSPPSRRAGGRRPAPSAREVKMCVCVRRGAVSPAPPVGRPPPVGGRLPQPDAERRPARAAPRAARQQVLHKGLQFGGGDVGHHDDVRDVA